MIRRWQRLGALLEVTDVVHTKKTETEVCPGIILFGMSIRKPWSKLCGQSTYVIPVGLVYHKSHPFIVDTRIRSQNNI